MNKPKILVVEDECVTAMEIRKLLESAGYEPHNARSTQDPVKRTREIKPQLLIVDTELEGQNNGIKTVEKIREFSDVPVIYLTAHFDKKTLGAAKLTRPQAYLLKPFEENHLINNIELALYNHEKALEERMVKKNESRDDIYTFFGTVGTLLASAVPFKEKGNILIQFSRYFEDKIKPGFLREVRLKTGREDEKLNAYMSYLSTKFSNWGFVNNKMCNHSQGYLIILKCPWMCEKHGNDIFCLLCQSMAKQTFYWMDFEGEVGQESSFLSGATFCKFKFQLK